MTSRADKPKKAAEPRAAYAPAAGAGSSAKHNKELDKLAAFFETHADPDKQPPTATPDSGASSLDDAMAEWNAVWAQANKAGIRGSQYFAGPIDTLSTIVEKIAPIKRRNQDPAGNICGQISD